MSVMVLAGCARRVATGARRTGDMEKGDMAEQLKLNTTQLQRGDIVRTHGMRVLIDVEPTITRGEGGSGRECYAWVGLVLNPDEAIEEGLVPRSWLFTDGIGQPRTEPRWNVQGNELAMWQVERP